MAYPPLAQDKLGSMLPGWFKNTQKITIPGSNVVRIPDKLTDTIIGEAKNVRYQALTSQLRDYLKFAESQPGMKMELWVRDDTRLSKPLWALIESGRIALRIMNFDE